MYGLQKFSLRDNLMFDENLSDLHMIIKQSSRKVYDEAFRLCQTHPGARVLLEGLQGVGKSRNLLYILRKLLLNDRVVFYQDCKRETVYAFLPSPSGYK
jgi:predicted AAA+ superfamily ATPase